jgi:hypothetical protein
LFTRLAVAESELQAMKDVLSELLDMLAAVKANQDELRRVHDEWRWWAEGAAMEQRKSWWLRVIARIGVINPRRLTSPNDNAQRPNAAGSPCRR